MNQLKPKNLIKIKILPRNQIQIEGFNYSLVETIKKQPFKSFDRINKTWYVNKVSFNEIHKKLLELQEKNEVVVEIIASLLESDKLERQDK